MTTPAHRTAVPIEVVEPSVLAETRAFNAELERVLATQPTVDMVPIELVRRARREGKGPFPPPVYLPEARDLDVPARGGRLRLRVLAPDSSMGLRPAEPGSAPYPARPATGVYLHVHGGGWALGAADMQDVALREIARGTGLTAVSVDYRLAPEHPYPAAADDCEDAALWLLDHGAADLGAPPRFVIGGESAGAHLAVLTLLRLRDRHGRGGAFHAANLVFGAFDMTRLPSHLLWGDRNLVLSAKIMRFFGNAFLPGMSEEARRSPDVSPLFADLRGMPPAIFTVGTQDPLLDDSLFMAARWSVAGAPAELRVWPEAIHGFTAFPTAMTRAAVAAQIAFMAAAVG